MRTLIITFTILTLLTYFFLSSGERFSHNQKPVLASGKPVENADLKEINDRNLFISSFLCDDLRVIAQSPEQRAVRVGGSIAYQKERKFRLELGTILGSELDVGSDGEVFWFWSKRAKQQGLFWASFKDVNKTRLKTPFNPLWLSGCLGFEVVKGRVDSSGDRWVVINETTNAKGEPVKTAVYIDPQKKLITGHGVYNSSGRLVASSEIQSFKDGLPSKITFIWHEEEASMVWYLNSSKKNVPINPNRFVMPAKTPKIDMAND